MEGHTLSHNRVGLVLGLPFGRLVVPREWAVALATISWPLNLNIMYVTVHDRPVAEAREFICDRALQVEAPYIWFVDDDTIPPRKAIRELVYALEQAPNAAACGGIYCEKSTPPTPLVFKEAGAGAYWDWKVGEIFDVKVIGTGCLLVRTEALKKISKPWFSVAESTEDVYFCNKLVENGYRIIAHGGVLCDHYDLTTGVVYSLPKDSRPYAQAV